MYSDDSSPPPSKPYLVLEPKHATAPPDATRALFVGTSHTEYHSMPEIASRLAARTLYCRSITHPLRALDEHFAQPHTRAVIESAPWNAIVLQERTLLPLEELDRHVRAVQSFVTIARAIGARVLLQRHWPRAPWHKDYQGSSAVVGATPQIMFERISQYTERVRDELSIELAPVGDAWMLALRELAPQRMYYRGGNHANLPGAILTAHVYATMLTGAPSLAEGFRHEACWDLSEHLRAWAHAALCPATGP